MSVRDRAAARLQTAHEIVRDLDLFGRWSQYGEPLVVGSVAIGVVVQPDIDIEIYSDSARVSDGFAVMSALGDREGSLEAGCAAD